MKIFPLSLGFREKRTAVISILPRACRESGEGSGTGTEEFWTMSLEGRYVRKEGEGKSHKSRS